MGRLRERNPSFTPEQLLVIQEQVTQIQGIFESIRTITQNYSEVLRRRELTNLELNQIYQYLQNSSDAPVV